MIKIGAIGHRNLKNECTLFYREQVSNLLLDLNKKYNDIIIYSPISEGADQLIIKEAVKLNIEYIAILPMPEEFYILDFNHKSKKEYKKLLYQAKKIISLPLKVHEEKTTIRNSDIHREIQYELAGHYIADECDILIALWDQKHNGLKGGTSETVRYLQKKEKYNFYYLPVSRVCDIHNSMVEFKHIKKME